MRTTKIQHILICLTFLSLSLLVTIPGNAKTPVSFSDSTSIVENKTGTGWGAIPIFSYDADLGLKYGAILNVFDYGDGTKYPDYVQYLKLRIANSTKKNTQFQVLFDSDKIFNNTKVIMEATYISDRLLNFYGFNGINAIYNRNITNPDKLDYQNTHFYAMRRNVLRGRVDIQKNLGTPNVRLLLGFTYNYFQLNSVNHDRFESPTGDANISPQPTGLYNKYIDWNIISEDEKEGGTINYFNPGLVIDTRDNQCACNSGLWLETYWLYSPKFMSAADFSKFVFTFRHYIDMPKPGLVFSYRLSSQTKTSGDIPFYMLPTYFDSKLNQDGLGGGFNLRGALRNRIVADGFASGNFELRKKALNKRIFGLDIDVWLSAFSDLAYITQSYKINTDMVPINEYDNYFNTDKQKLIGTYGFGLYFIYNKNNIISVNYGISPNKAYGENGIYIGSSFLF